MAYWDNYDPNMHRPAWGFQYSRVPERNPVQQVRAKAVYDHILQYRYNDALIPPHWFTEPGRIVGEAAVAGVDVPVVADDGIVHAVDDDTMQYTNTMLQLTDGEHTIVHSNQYWGAPGTDSIDRLSDIDRVMSRSNSTTADSLVTAAIYPWPATWPQTASARSQALSVVSRMLMGARVHDAMFADAGNDGDALERVCGLAYWVLRPRTNRMHIRLSPGTSTGIPSTDARMMNIDKRARRDFLLQLGSAPPLRWNRAA
tara:strand:+ start:114 stop:884 length:771 start_codon:yes stop_codon:yes gene_type:complete